MLESHDGREGPPIPAFLDVLGGISVREDFGGETVDGWTVEEVRGVMGVVCLVSDFFAETDGVALPLQDKALRFRLDSLDAFFFDMKFDLFEEKKIVS